MRRKFQARYVLEPRCAGANAAQSAIAKPWVFACLLVTGLAGCKSMHQSVDFERHTMSTFYESRTGDGSLIFEARTDGNYPADDAAAETRRIEWLEKWLSLRKLCPAGYEVLERKPIGKEDLNTYRNNLRYILRCTS